MEVKQSLKGRTFGKLTVLYRRSQADRKFEYTLWQCRCECGAEIRTNSERLLRGSTTSCGCDTVEPDITGKKYRNMVVLGKTEKTTRRGRGIWSCRCDTCETVLDLPAHAVRQGRYECECEPQVYRVKRTNKVRFCGLMPLYFVTKMKGEAEKRNLEFTLTPEIMWEVFQQQDGKCVLSGIELSFVKEGQTSRQNDSTASLDRIDSTKGYVAGNVQWVHKHINFMKQAFPDEYFIGMCRTVTLNQARRYVL